MKIMFKAALLATIVSLASSAFAQAPADAPAGTTGLCKDGSYYSGATKKGACRGHKGVKDWYAADDAAAASPAAASSSPAPAAAPTPAAKPTPAAPPASTASAAVAPVAKPTKASAAPVAQAAGGGPGLVWVNSASNTYHCPGTKYYGKTKAGSYMSEADAKAKGAHADHGKACTQ